MKNAIILASGGLDSTVLAYFTKKKLMYENIKIIFFDYGQKALKEEEFCCEKLSKDLGAELKKIELKWLGEISTSSINVRGTSPETKEEDLEKEDKHLIDWWVPCRNSIFLINSLAFAESEFLRNKRLYDIFIGLINEGRSFMNDTTNEFINKINELSEHSTFNGKYRVIAPLLNSDKADVIKIGAEIGVPFEYTYSCYIGGNSKNKDLVHCGRCLNCMLRKKSFYWANLKDVTKYKE